MAKARRPAAAVEETATGTGRPIPRPFAFHWGGGEIIEEASYTGRYAEPSIQLLAYSEEPGTYGIRFCYYNLDGRFQRSPMMIDGDDSLQGLRAALRHTPRLRSLLRQLVS
jgi:hypothetical protein